MQTEFKKYIRYSFSALMLIVLGAGMLFTSCEDDDDEGNDKVELFSYGPMPIARGAELRFIGDNLDKVMAIIIPDGIEIDASEFTTRTPELITLTVPQNAGEGLVVLKTPQGDIITKTPIGYSEPISIDEFTPATIRPGEVLTINGDYLNLVKEVIFTDRVVADTSFFESQSRKELKVTVPEAAQTGIIGVSNGEEEPVIVYSESELNITLPVFDEISPNPVKAGSELTISGSDLDLVVSLKLGGDIEIGSDDFVSQSADQIVISVPLNTRDGNIVLLPLSGVEVISGTELQMLLPTINSIVPLTLKNGEDITVTGENLDLISSVVFEGGFEGVIAEGGTPAEITVTTPDGALSGAVVFNTLAQKSVTGDELNFLAPSLTSFSPSEIKPNNLLTITGENLDLVDKVIFSGGVEGEITSQTETEIIVTVKVGSETGVITLVAINGVEVESSGPVTILSNLPDVTGYEESKATPGQILTILGSNLDLIKELVFPGEIKATAYGVKTDTRVEVYVPEDVPTGNGQIRVITYEGEEGLLPEIFFGGVDPVLYPDLVFNDFDEEGHSLDWDNWGGISALMDDGNGVSGKYLKGAAQLGAWDWKWVWGCNHNDDFPKPEVNADNHVVKIDVKIEGVISDDSNNFQLKLAGKDSQWFKLGFQNDDGTWGTGDGWVTVTYNLNDIGINGDITNSGDWGLITQPPAGLDFTRISLDNFRFEPVP
ncbi:MAG: hypothetical protein PWQ17_947 [Anaerophaga sp.]|nr:hypothetical protein [Anaerophaga sp.]